MARIAASILSSNDPWTNRPRTLLADLQESRGFLEVAGRYRRVFGVRHDRAEDAGPRLREGIC